MRYLSKLRHLESFSAEQFFIFQNYKFQNSQLSIHFKSSFHHSSVKTQEARLKKQKSETKDIGSLFNEIADIINIENFSQEKSSTGFSISQQDTHLRNLNGTPHVCEIAKESTLVADDKILMVEKNSFENPDENDVSPIVHKITEIIRADNPDILMEERLEKLDFQFDADIVEKVLKRCFKVGHLALKFFNWVNLRTGFHHTTKTYNTMIYIAGEAREFDLVENLVDEMGKNLCPKDIKTWTILISHYGKAKMIGKALLIFEKMRKSGCEPDGMTYKEIIHALCTAKKAEIAMEFYKEMVNGGMSLDLNLFKPLLNCLSNAGDIHSICLVADDMRKLSQIPELKVYSCMLKSFCISGRIKEALELVRELKNKNISLASENFENLIKGLSRGDRIVDALEIIDIMKKTHLVNGKVYGIIFNWYMRRNEFSKALELFHSMKESGHLPTASTYTELMQHLFRSNEYEKACDLYKEMLENGVELDSVAIMALVVGHVRHNHVSEALQVFESMKEKCVRTTQRSYSIFIKELCKVSRTDEAFKLLNEMQDSKIKTGDDIFLLLISSLKEKGEMKKVERVNQVWRATQPFNHLPLYEGSNRVGDVSEPFELNQEFNSHQIPRRAEVHFVEPLPKVYGKGEHQEICKILSSSMDWCLMQNALEKCTVQFTPELVVDVLRSCQQHSYAALRFFSWVGQQPGYSHTTETYNMGIKISGCAKDFIHMRNLYLEMRRRGCLVTSDTWTIVIMQYGRVGLTEIALKKFKDMKADGCKPSENTYKYLIIFLCGRKGRKVDEAIETFHKMIRDGYMPDKELAEIYLRCLCEVGKLSEARRCTESLCNGGFTIPFGYSLLIRALCRAGKLEQALELVDEIGAAESTLNQYTYGTFVHGLLRAGQLDEALAKVDTMRQVGVNPTVHVYTSLMVHFFKEKQVEKALEIFKQMREEGCEPTIVTYYSLIHGYMNMGMVFSAWSVFRRIMLKGPFPDFKTYSMFISCLCKMGRSEEALQLIYEMLDNGIFPSTFNFRTVFYGLNREGKHDLANTVLQKKWALNSGRKILK